MKMIPPKFTLKDWSVEERPREKLISLGAQQLSNAELLALLIGSENPGETAVQLMQRLMASLNNDLGLMDIKKRWYASGGLGRITFSIE